MRKTLEGAGEAGHLELLGVELHLGDRRRIGILVPFRAGFRGAGHHRWSTDGTTTTCLPFPRHLVVRSCRLNRLPIACEASCLRRSWCCHYE